MVGPYRVLVVDDSAFMRTIISDLILQDDQFIIAATAANGVEAVSAAAELKPDVITMDLEMPMMNGIEALQLIMKSTPTPVIMLSGISEDNTRDTIKALQYGAFDFIRKPSSAMSSDIHQVGEQLLEKLKVAVFAKRSRKSPPVPETRSQEAARIEQPAPPLRKPQAPKIEEPKKQAKTPLHTVKKSEAERTDPTAERKRPKEKEPAAPARKMTEKSSSVSRPIKDAGLLNQKSSDKNRPAGSTSFKHIVAIGTSTGGPRALHEVICSLPEGFPAPVLVVQHMPPKFTRSLAQRLDSFSSLKVVEAEANMRVAAGTVYIAPGGYHMELAKDSAGYAIHLSDQPQRNGHRPSVDVLFESIANYRELQRHAVIMTGMGSDGAKGMKVLAEQGDVTTIAEAEETCIVYGMPRCAVEMGAAGTVLPLQAIASKLEGAVST
ncbi:chemotaxis response regulator protein-glutamate methylesterase [Paenibacillus sp. GCM10027627]|uniref:protein-glutamate methylesterase/protein-glutamine glutaminase n=1 Tax=unclassified Paenibacillus TaxID=185978 RepID=UPI00362E742B